MKSKNYTWSAAGKDFYFKIMNLLRDVEIFYKRAHPEEFVVCIALDIDTYDELAGYLLNDEITKFEYMEYPGLPESIRGIPLCISDKPGIQICIKPIYISLYGLPIISI